MLHSFTEITAFVENFMVNPRFRDIRMRLSSALSKVESLKVGSLFTGWGVLEMVLEKLQISWNQVCEKDGGPAMKAGRVYTLAQIHKY